MRRKIKEESIFSKPLSWLFLILFLTAAVYLVNLNSTLFKASLLQDKIHKPFDGTVMPIKKAPNWVKLSGDEWNYSYDKLEGLSKLTDIPSYEPTDLAKPVSSLKFGDTKDDTVRNAKITYSVSYMGNYELDGVENVGSHLGVDIKLPNGTPLYAIANGVVTKVALQSSGFGKHIVIRHSNFPTLDNANTNETFYSCYAHLGDLAVAEGQVVTKGQQIGVTGNSGITTTPHLHFQIDNSLAQWHPFWPFTYQESVDAGYSFFEAINKGLGKERALANTVNPMKYVQKYLNYQTPAETVTETPEETPETVVDQPAQTPAEVPPVVETPAVETPTVTESSYKFEHDSEFEVGKPEKIRFVIDGAYPFAIDELIVFSTSTGDAEFGQKLFSGLEYNNGFEFFVTPTSAKTLRIQAQRGDEIFAVSDPLNTKGFSDVSVDHKNYAAIKYLYEQGVISGYPDGTFRPDNTVSRVEALKFILSGIQKELSNSGSLPFPDVLVDAWYSDYVETAYEDGIVKGYPDGTFGPSKTVNKAEFFKILLLAMEVDVAPEVTGELYNDVTPESWFAPYVQFVKEKNLLDAFADMFKPQDGMTRGEVAEAMFRVMILSKTSADKFSTDLVEGVMM